MHVNSLGIIFLKLVANFQTPKVWRYFILLHWMHNQFNLSNDFLIQ